MGPRSSSSASKREIFKEPRPRDEGKVKGVYLAIWPYAVEGEDRIPTANVLVSGLFILFILRPASDDVKTSLLPIALVESLLLSQSWWTSVLYVWTIETSPYSAKYSRFPG